MPATAATAQQGFVKGQLRNNTTYGDATAPVSVMLCGGSGGMSAHACRPVGLLVWRPQTSIRLKSPTAGELCTRPPAWCCVVLCVCCCATHLCQPCSPLLPSTTMSASHDSTYLAIEAPTPLAPPLAARGVACTWPAFTCKHTGRVTAACRDVWLPSCQWPDLSACQQHSTLAAAHPFPTVSPLCGCYEASTHSPQG